MIRTEDDLRSYYSDLADTAPVRLPVVPPEAGSRRRFPALAGAAVAAVAITALALVLPGTQHRTPIPGVTIGPAVAQADPVIVLWQAATAAAAQPYTVPRADQFYYVRTRSYEAWFSMDGTHDGAIGEPGHTPTVLPGCRHGASMQPGNYEGLRPQPCTPDPASLPDAPTSTAAMTQYLQQHYGTTGLNGIGKGADGLLRQHYLRPASRAAIFTALSRLTGLRVVDEPSLGSQLIGITWTVSGENNQPQPGQSRTTLLFDRSTHGYLGLSTVGIEGEPGGGPDTLRTGVVDRVGQRP